jgi:ComF family protein
LTTLTALLDPFLSLLYPPRCLVCRALGECGLCARCLAQIVPVEPPFCRTCGHPFSPEGGCASCAARRPAFTRSRSLGAYDGILRVAIHQLKYRDRPQLATPLGQALAVSARTQAADLNGLRFDALLPVPMHPIRRRLRGYNQSERLAKIVATELVLPLWNDALRRTHPTSPQVGLDAAARRTNLQGAFTVLRPEVVAGKTLLLIDDVITTGSSLHECALVLKAAGAQAVFALTLAAG